MTTEKLLIDKQDLLASLLQEQQQLTAVEDFAQQHESQTLPIQQKYYEDLIPMGLPGEGQQFAFRVDLERCTGCKACVTACHNLNGLDDTETWRSVGVLRGGNKEDAKQQHVTTACHHCLEPACSTGCPVNAYEKDEVTGIVSHLDDQCIGCQYCVLKCPYEVPQYNKRLGIVRKCDMCSSRLKKGEAPACVQACPTKAISIKIVDKDKMLENAQDSVLVPGAPSSEHTQPTTRFVSSKPLSKNMLGSDYFSLKPLHSHPPLIGMLVLTQLSVGAFCVDVLLSLIMGTALSEQMQAFHSIVALCLGILALKVSILNLGRPLYAFRAVLGLRTSWLSREIVGFGIFSGLATVYAALFWLDPIQSFIGIELPGFLKSSNLRDSFGLAVAASGILGVICSVMVYDDCKKELWRGSITGLKFFGTTIGLGLNTILATSLSAVFFMEIQNENAIGTYVSALALIAAGVFTAKLAWEASIFRHLNDTTYSMAKRSALLMKHHLMIQTRLRYIFGLVGGVVLPLFIYKMSQNEMTPDNLRNLVILAIVSLVISLVGEFLERFLFFAAGVSKKMPGGS